MTAAQPVGDEATTLTEDERDAIIDALIDDRSRDEGYVVTGPGGTDGNTPTIYEAVAAILTARLASARDDRGAAVQQAGTTVTEWGVLMAGETEPEDVVDSRGDAEFVMQDTRESIEKWEWDADDYEPMTLVTRQRTTYPDRVTEWTAAAAVDTRGETGGGES